MSKRRPYQEKVVVITGASSGLGRASAVEFARQGARLSLIARHQGELESLAAELRGLGAETLTFTADVASADALKKAADETARHFGHIDVWFNNAGIAVYGELDKVPLPDLRRVMDVNFFGQLNGIRAALPHLEASPEGGVIIGSLSVLSEAATPLQGVYTASKHALFGLYKVLREELIHRKSRVRISTLFIPSLATPLFDHARTYIAYRPKPLAPIYDPTLYARIVARQGLKPQFRCVRRGFAHFALSSFRHSLRLANWFQGKTGYQSQRSKDPKGIHDGDNVFTLHPQQFGIYGSTKPTPGAERVEKILNVLAIAGLATWGYAKWTSRSGAITPQILRKAS